MEILSSICVVTAKDTDYLPVVSQALSVSSFSTDAVSSGLCDRLMVDCRFVPDLSIYGNSEYAIVWVTLGPTVVQC